MTVPTLATIQNYRTMNIEQIYKSICEMLAVADEKEMAQNRVYSELFGNLEMAKYDAEILLHKRDWPMGY